MSGPDINDVLALVDYDASTGVFLSKKSQGRMVKGAPAGALRSDGYRVISVRGKSYRAHRLAWLISYGKWPALIDHINRDRDDNRIANLREATKPENMANSVLRDGKPITGTRWAAHAKRWMARTTIAGKTVFLGYFDTQEKAAAAYRSKRRELFPEFAP